MCACVRVCHMDLEEEKEFSDSDGECGKRKKPEKDGFEQIEVPAEQGNMLLEYRKKLEQCERMLKHLEATNRIDEQNQAESDLWGKDLDVLTHVMESTLKDNQHMMKQQCKYPSWKRALSMDTFIKQTPVGQKRMDDLRMCLDRFNNFGFQNKTVKRSSIQREFHEAMTNACAKSIYTPEELKVNYRNIMQLNGWEEIRQEVMISLYRRGGKSWAVAMYCAAYLITQPYCQILIFSPSIRQSRELLKSIRNFVRALMKPRESKSYTVVSNADSYKINPSGVEDDIRSITAFPANSDTIRGHGGDLIIIDEATFMRQDVFVAAILPMLMLNNAALICLSTLTDTDNYYAELVDMVHPDDPTRTFFKTFVIMRICDDCRRLGNQMTCDHQESPEWLSDERFDTIKRVMEMRWPEEFKNEILGQVRERKVRVFDSKLVSDIKTLGPIVDNTFPTYAYVSVDPGAFGVQSNTGLVSGYYNQNGVFIITGIENIDTKEVTCEATVIRDHCLRLLGMPRFQNVNRIIMIFENNLGKEVYWMQNYIHQTRNINVSFYTPYGDRSGVTTTDSNKEEFTMCAIQALRDQKIRTSKDMFSIFAERNGGSIEDTTDTFIKQLENFQVHARNKNNNVFAREKIVFSGKSANSKDDLVMSFLLCLGWSKTHRRSAATLLRADERYI